MRPSALELVTGTGTSYEAPSTGSAPFPGWALHGVLALRDPELALHSSRGTLLSLSLAREIGFDIDPEVFWGFLLHDVGSLETPESILGKPGPLTESEKGILATHPLRSAHLLGQTAGLAEAAPIALHHHERWDGLGYPNGLSGNAVPFESRILSVADAFAAMTTHRPHRSARGPEEALSAIVDGAGTQFDPEVASAFRSLAPYLPPGLLESPALEDVLRGMDRRVGIYASRAQDLSRGQLEALFATALGLDAGEAADRFGRSMGTQRNWVSSLRRALACPPRLALPRFLASLGRSVYDSVRVATRSTATV